MSDNPFLEAVESRRFQPVHYETEVAESLHAELHDALKGRSSLGYADTSFANVIDGFGDDQLRDLNQAYKGLYGNSLGEEIVASGIVDNATMESLGRRLHGSDPRTKEEIQLSQTYDQNLFVVERDLRLLSNALMTISKDSRETVNPFNNLADSARHFDAQITAEDNLAKKIGEWGASGELVAMDAAERKIANKSLVQIVEDNRVSPALCRSILRQLAINRGDTTQEQ